MCPLPPSVAAIVEIENRQDEVLAALADLERRTEQALAEFVALIKGTPAAEAVPPAAEPLVTPSAAEPAALGEAMEREVRKRRRAA